MNYGSDNTKIKRFTNTLAEPKIDPEFIDFNLKIDAPGYYSISINLKTYQISILHVGEWTELS